MNALAKSARSQLASKSEAMALDHAWDEAAFAVLHSWKRVWEVDAQVQETQAWANLENPGTNKPFRNITEWRDVKLAKSRSRSRVMQIIADGRILEKASAIKDYETTPDASAKELARHFKTNGFSGAKALIRRANEMPEDEFKPYIRGLSSPKLDSQINWSQWARTLQTPVYDAQISAEAIIKRARDMDPESKDWSMVYEANAAVIAYVGAERIRELLDNGRIAGFPPAGGVED